jgi:hypothetical protein
MSQERGNLRASVAAFNRDDLDAGLTYLDPDGDDCWDARRRGSDRAGSPGDGEQLPFAWDPL